MPHHTFIKESIFEHKQFPLWIPYYSGGEPFFAAPANTIFNIPTFLYMFISDLTLSIYLETLIQFILGAVFMYYLAINLNLKPKFAVISSMVFVMNAFFLEHLFQFGSEWISSYIWIPLIFLLCVKSLKSDKYIRYAMLLGLVFAVQFHAGNLQIFIYTTLLISLYFIFNIKKENIKKIMIIGLISIIILLGLVSIKLFPLIEFGRYSNVQYSDFDYLRGSYLEIDNLKDIAKPFLLMTTKSVNGGSFSQISIGIIGFILVLLAFKTPKDKNVLFFSIAILILFLIASNLFTFYSLSKFYPGFNKQKHIGRILYLVPFCCAYLAGKGASNFFKKKYAYWFLIIILFIDIGYVDVRNNFQNRHNTFNINEDLIEENQLFQYLKEDKELFRVYNFNRREPGGTTSSLYGTPLGIQSLEGTFNVWVMDYWIFLLTGFNSSIIDHLSVLNTKYIYSDKELNVSGLKFIDRFEKCDTCIKYVGEELNDTYLYLNEKSLPRAFMNDTAMPITYYSPNKVIIELNGEVGTMILSEKYAMFPGWTAKINGKEKELQRWKVLTLIDLKGEQGDLIIKYMPKSFFYGAIISGLTFMIVMGFLLMLLLREW